MSECCKVEKKDNSIISGICCGLIPHIGCIGFIIGSILGVTVLSSVFKPLMSNAYFFYILIGLSIIFASISVFLYLKKHNCCSVQGIKENKKYVLTTYGSTIIVSALFLLIIFPAVNAAAYNTQPIGNDVLKLEVNIPCSGHTSLIIDELKKEPGILGVSSSTWNTFDISFDSKLITKEKILEIEIFKQYKAKIL